MDVIASARYIRQSPRKVRLVATAVRELPPAEALGKLQLTNAKAATAVAAVIQSALANATNNFQLPASSLRIKTLEVGEGPTLKRFRARSRGMANSVHKRTSHIRVVLTDEPAASKALPGSAAVRPAPAKATAEAVEVTATKRQPSSAGNKRRSTTAQAKQNATDSTHDQEVTKE